MRRALSIVMLALFWLAPLAALIPGADEAALPACCRRHGAHHCAMAMGMADAALPGNWFATSSHCPRYTVAPVRLLQSFLVPPARSLSVHFGSRIEGPMDPAVRSFPIANLTVRGPPISC